MKHVSAYDKYLIKNALISQLFKVEHEYLKILGIAPKRKKRTYGSNKKRIALKGVSDEYLKEQIIGYLKLIGESK
jgi:hypothetical protein